MENGSQVIMENGRVSSLFKTINGIAIVVISALLLWMASTLTQLNAQVAVLIAQNNALAARAIDNRELRNREHDRFDARISKLEDHVVRDHK